MWVGTNIYGVIYTGSARVGLAMPAVELTIDLPPQAWITELTAAFPDQVFRVLTILIDDGTGHAVLEIETVEPSEIVERLQGRPELTAVDLLSVDSSRAIFQIETEQTSILEPFLSAGVPLETPIQIADGVAEWTFQTSQNRLSVLSTQLRSSALSYEVNRIGATDPLSESSDPGLTDRQRDVFEAAHEVGYFEIPKHASIEDVAEEAGVNKSTANGIVRRAVRNLVDWYIARS